jgi:membrane associated rhomboid family serine protease
MGSFSITQIMIGVLAAAFLVEIVASGSAQLIFGPTPRQMIRVGATDPILIAIRGQYWRFFTSMFLHYGVFHLAVNCYALWILGSAVETDYGKVRWLIFFVLTGIAGGVSSYAFGPVAGAGAGASGAIFGLMGAFLAYSYRRRATQIGRMRIQAVVQTLILNLVITVALSFIDWRAHLGGFVVGVAAGALLDPGPRELPRAAQVAGMLLLVVGIAGVAAWRTTELRAAFGL